MKRKAEAKRKVEEEERKRIPQQNNDKSRSNNVATAPKHWQYSIVETVAIFIEITPRQGENRKKNGQYECHEISEEIYSKT